MIQRKVQDSIKTFKGTTLWFVVWTLLIAILQVTFSTQTSTAVPTYTVTFKPMGGAWGADGNDQVSLPQVDGTDAFSVSPGNGLTKSGYVFTGWKLTLDNQIYSSYLFNGSNLIFEAQWASAYTVTFKPMGGAWGADTNDQVSLPQVNGVNAFSVAPGSDPTKSGYVFTGWKLVADGQIYTSYSVNGADLVFEAQWTAGYTATFDPMGGAWGSDTRTQVSLPQLNGTDAFSVAPNTDPTKSGFAFYGWKLTSNGTVYSHYSISSADVIFEAQWGTGYTVTFKPMGGAWGADGNDQVSDLMANGTDAFDVSPGNSLTKNGYTFAGWKLTTDNQIYSSYMFNGSNLIFEAQWTIYAPPSSSSSREIFNPIYPTVNWEPEDMYLGDLVSDKYQLNATFSVEGKVQYSVNPGFTPELGNFDITLTFTPDDLRRYYVISTTRTINVTQLNFPQGDSSKTKLNPSQFQLKLIGNILFNKNEYFLDSQDRKKISDYASQIKAAKSNNVIILGNSDLKNGVDNIWLSKSRADAVSKYFGNFLPTSTLTRAWYGPTRPAVIGVDKESLAKNRRVEIYIQVPKSELEAIAVNPVFKEFAPISFNRNEYFLDARDRKALLNYAKSMTSLGCTLVSIVGTEDFKKGGLPNIGDLRSTAVKDYLETLNGQLNFQLLDSETSDKREVRISCKTK